MNALRADGKGNVHTVVYDKGHVVAPCNGVYLLGKLYILSCTLVLLTKLKKGRTAFERLFNTKEEFFLGVVRAVGYKI